ncbi:hypothetical protein AB8O64_22820 [Streptomyces sp. QH1-20]|uniref:hypothetical protein n=1 Tax=Streptomyces sp. QH1-20 TaxID=3240934 RepID=UPI0035119E41
MMVLAEFLPQFLPSSVRTRRAYLMSCLLAAALAGLVTASLMRFFAQPAPRSTLWWAAGTAACAAAGYLLAYPLAKKRLLKDEQ